ncbi:MAG: rod shape-determining protein MreC [Robiginitomaculum sp.]|nr:rod shape-determining protein MreC [Robiginitomaculum sp.]
MSNSGYNRPQRRRNLRRGLAAFLVLISAFMLLADRQQEYMLASGRLKADDVSAKIMGFIATPVRGMESLFTGAENRKNAYEDNIRLRAEVERLRVFENRVLDVEMRVRRFEDMLSMGNSSDLPDTKVIARAVSESMGPFVHSALINVGRNKNISVGDAVMTTDGLYGHIIRSGSGSSRVLLLNDLSSRISVMSQRSLSRAILLGTNTKRPRLDYVSLEADWQIGDRVVTSGDGGVLPRGLQIGVIVAGQQNDFEVELFYLDKPVDWVWVYPFTPISAPEETLPSDNLQQGDGQHKAREKKVSE